MPSSTSSFSRVIPPLPWRAITLSVVLTLVALTTGWEMYSRSLGYGPTLNNTGDLWAEARRRVEPESIVIVGDSRALFDLDLDELEEGFGKRPIQLAQLGSTAFPFLTDLANDPSFHGTILCSVVPRLFFAPPGSPPMKNAEKAVHRRQTQTLAQRAGHHLGVQLEGWFASLKQEDLTLGVLLAKLPIPNRPHAQIPPTLPPYMASLDRERRARMSPLCERPGKLQERIRLGWIPLFTLPPPPSYLPREQFGRMMHEAFEKRFTDTKALVDKFRARGGRIVFVRFPVCGELKKLEDKGTPRTPTWDRLLKETKAPGIHFEDYPELATFTCPEWSHLSAGDSVEFTKRLVPHLRSALDASRVASSR